jgi:hypothetical protein
MLALSHFHAQQTFSHFQISFTVLPSKFNNNGMEKKWKGWDFSALVQTQTCPRFVPKTQWAYSTTDNGVTEKITTYTLFMK